MITVNMLNDFHATDFVYQINFYVASTGEEHPLSHGSCLVTGRANLKPRDAMQSKDVIVTVLGDTLAFYDVVFDTSYLPHYSYWSLHVWKWHQGAGQVDLGHLCDRRRLWLARCPFSYRGEALSSHTTRPYRAIRRRGPVKDTAASGKIYDAHF
ncbi:hypothetical protein DFH29DRAFT_204190 [Suillus ampliporus]|nr:hypothetical protein DFH29DRAFT_204190 [Suillus ampliporus]